MRFMSLFQRTCLIEENVRSTPDLIGTEKDFLNRILIVQVSRPINNKRDLMNQKFPYSTGHHHLSEKAAYTVGKMF